MARASQPDRCWMLALLLPILVLTACGSPAIPAAPTADRGIVATPPVAAYDQTPSPAAPGGRGPLASTATVNAPLATAGVATALPGAVAAELPSHSAMLPPLKAGLVWRSEGAPRPLDRPAALALDRHGQLYVVDAGHGRIAVFDRDGRFVRDWGSLGGDAGQFRFLTADHCRDGYHAEACSLKAGGGVAIDEQDRVYVADYGNHRVQTFDHTGRFLASWGREGNGPGAFRLPGGIAVDSQGHVYVSDGMTWRIQVFDRDGTFLAQWARPGMIAGAVTRPNALAIDGDGQVYVADAWTRRVQVFDGQGRLQREWAPPDAGVLGPPLSMRYAGLAVDRQGRAYVAGADQVIWQFDRTGQLLVSWRTDWPGGSRLLHPSGLAVDEAGDVYVADQTNDWVGRFRLLAPATR